MTVRPVSKAFERQKMNGFASVWLGVELETPSWSCPARALLYSLTAEKQNWNRQPTAVYNYNKSRTTTENNREQQNPKKKKKPARKTQPEPNLTWIASYWNYCGASLPVAVPVTVQVQVPLPFPIALTIAVAVAAQWTAEKEAGISSFERWRSLKL